MQIPRNQNVDTHTVLPNHGVNTQSPCRITRILTNDRFRGQRLLCQRRVVTMNFLYNLASHQRLKKCILRARLLQELLALREPNETGAYRSQSAIATTPVDQLQIDVHTTMAYHAITAHIVKKTRLYNVKHLVAEQFWVVAGSELQRWICSSCIKNIS